MMTTGIQLAISEDAASITINRPETRNAITMDDFAAFHAALHEIKQKPGLRALVITGAGDRAFSAGADLGDVGGDAAAWDENPLRVLSDRIEAFPLPTIARLNGAVIGGAAELALACDYRIGRAGVTMRVPASRIGLHYEPEGLRRAVSVLGLQAARRIYVLGEAQDDAALERLGFLDRLVAADALDEAVAEMLDLIRAGAPLAVNGMKTTLSEIARGTLDHDAARSRVRASWASEDMQEGLAALKEKRAPNFKGR